jgi:hypothetical protein
MKLNDTINKLYIFLGCIGVILLFRIIPHPPNFTPVIALSFLSTDFIWTMEYTIYNISFWYNRLFYRFS